MTSLVAKDPLPLGVGIPSDIVIEPAGASVRPVPRDRERRRMLNELERNSADVHDEPLEVDHAITPIVGARVAKIPGINICGAVKLTLRTPSASA